MKLKDRLNEFEADWCAVPSIEKEQLAQLTNKTILVYGHTLARCFCYSLLYLNETKSLKNRVILAGNETKLSEEFYADLLLRNDFDYCNINSLKELSDIDYIVFCGFCNEHTTDNVKSFKEEINATNMVAEVAKKSGSKTILISDSRVYGNAEPHRIYSENEYAKIELAGTESFDTQLLRTIENLWFCHQKNNTYSLTVLRTGIILGACSGFESFVEPIFRAVANGEPCDIYNSVREYSFVYITDVFKAIIHSTGSLPTNTVYNVNGAGSTASTGMICATLHDIYSEDAKISLTESGDNEYCATNANKIAEYGCEPSINLKTALELCVMSYMPNNKAMTLPNNHDGRLSSLQNILLGYLLEVDRICRKHNIKYFLGGGTLLGAIRHHGFIPWDDDADIMMLREDYDKFCRIAQSEMPANMTFQTNENDKNCYYEFAKFRLNNTVFATGFSKTHKDMHNGIAFDIFCHDKTANSKLGQKLHLALTLFTRALVFNKWNNRKAENGSKIQSLLTNIFIKLLPLNFCRFLMRKTISMFKNKKNARFLYDGMGRNVYNGSFPIEYLDEVEYVDFEGYKLPVPKEYDKYLTFLYGDYMELAPLSTRLGCHDIKLCDIGEFEGFELSSAK